MVRSLAVAEESIMGPERAGIQRVESKAQDGKASPRGITSSEDRGMGGGHRRGLGTAERAMRMFTSSMVKLPMGIVVGEFRKDDSVDE